jgi:hypothetical protein
MTVGGSARSRQELLYDHGAQILEGREEKMKPLQLRVGLGLSEAADEYVRV